MCEVSPPGIKVSNGIPYAKQQNPVISHSVVHGCPVLLQIGGAR